MEKNQVSTVLRNRIRRANENGFGYQIPKSYNSIWHKHAERLVESGKASFNNGRSKQGGYHLVGVEIKQTDTPKAGVKKSTKTSSKSAKAAPRKRSTATQETATTETVA